MTEERKYSRRRVLKAVPMAALGLSAGMGNASGRTTRSRVSQQASGRRSVANTSIQGGWSQQVKLTPDDGDPIDSFGSSVTLDGARALVGAYGDEDPNGDDAGSAYVFERTNGSWTQQAKLIPDDGDADDLFGDAVALDGGTALVGAPWDEDPNGDSAGSAYVFERSNGSWAQQAKLAPDDGDAEDNFGSSVTLDGDGALVGANGDEDPNGANAGSAYVFEEGGTTGAGVPDRVYDAVAGTDGQLERDDVISMVRGYAQSGSVNGVDIDRDEVLSLVRYYVG